MVVGVGSFGAWWVVGLLRSKYLLNVFIHDPDPASKRLVAERIASQPERVPPLNTLSFAATLEELPRQPDLVVVATNADVRPLVVEALVKVLECDTWVLEKVLAQSTNGLDTLSEALKGKTVYANHSRRYQAATGFLAGLFVGRGTPASITLNGGLWELASNCFHFVDLVEYWFQTKVGSVDATGLGPWRASRTRSSGFEDVEGVISVGFQDGFTLRLNWNNPNQALWEFKFSSSSVTWNELTGSIQLDGEEIGRLPLTNFSDLVPTLVDRWWNTGSLYPLPSLERASKVHRHLLRELMNQYLLEKGNADALPIS